MAMKIAKNKGALSKNLGFCKFSLLRSFYKSNRNEKLCYASGPYLYTRMPSKSQLIMPSFILKLVDFPGSYGDSNDVRRLLKPLYDKKLDK